MADSVKINPKFAAKLGRIPPAVALEARRALGEAAGGIVAKMKARAPVDDGDLQMSITYRFGDEAQIKYSQTLGPARFGSNFRSTNGAGNNNALSVRISAGNTDVRYAHLVEFGAAPHIAGGQFAGAKHPGAPAQPFFYPTFRAERKPAGRKVARAWRKALKQATA